MSDRRRGKRRVEGEIEFLREPLRCSQSDQLQPRAVVLLHERRRRFPAHVTGIRIGDKSFRAVTGRDETVSPPILAGFFWNQKDHRPSVARGITWISHLPNFPLASDLERHFLYIASADIRKRDYRKLTPGFRAHVRRDGLNALRCVWRDDVREIVHQSGWGGDLDGLRKKQVTQQQCVQDLLSLDFMAR